MARTSTADTAAPRGRQEAHAGCGLDRLRLIAVTLFRGLGQTPDEAALTRRATAVHEQKRKATAPTLLGVGTLACGRCDAPIAVGDRPLLLTDRLTCPFCGRRGPARDFFVALTTDATSPRVKTDHHSVSRAGRRAARQLVIVAKPQLPDVRGREVPRYTVVSSRDTNTRGYAISGCENTTTPAGDTERR